MKLRELKAHVNKALAKCQNIISNHPYSILSEADFERILAFCISEEINEDVHKQPNQEDFSVHTQVSHYYATDGSVCIDSRVDILILKEHELNGKINRKGFEYKGDSIAIELKYLHKQDSVSIVECDFSKWNKLKSDSWMYIIVLLDNDDDKVFREKKKKAMI